MPVGVRCWTVLRSEEAGWDAQVGPGVLVGEIVEDFEGEGVCGLNGLWGGGVEEDGQRGRVGEAFGSR